MQTLPHKVNIIVHQTTTPFPDGNQEPVNGPKQTKSFCFI